VKKLPTVFLQAIVVLIGIGALVFMLWEPHLEGVNANATTLREIYFDDPFLAYAYLSSIAFFTVLYQAFKVLGLVRNNMTFSTATLKAVSTIKFCAAALIVLILAPLAYLLIARPEDDIAGGVVMGLGILLISTITAAAAAMFERVLRNTIER